MLRDANSVAKLASPINANVNLHNKVSKSMLLHGSVCSMITLMQFIAFPRHWIAVLLVFGIIDLTAARQPDLILKKLRLAVIAPADEQHEQSLSKILPSIELATKRVSHPVEGTLPGWDIEIQQRDSNCSSTTGPLAAFDFYLNNSAGLLIKSIFFSKRLTHRMIQLFVFNVPIIFSLQLISLLLGQLNYRRVWQQTVKLAGNLSLFTKHFSGSRALYDS